MAGFGFGFGRFSRRRTGRREAGSLPVRIQPSSFWNGTAGSGFAQAAAPVDPQRLTAKPAMRLLVPSDQFYSSGLIVGVVAGANNGGSLLQNMGLAGVRVHCEGSQQMIAEPTWRTYRDVNGAVRTCFGWWAQLVNDGRSGSAQVYFEAIPLDPAMQSRVIGPVRFYPTQALHDYSLTIEQDQPAIAGSRYPSVGQALAYLASVGAANPVVTIRGGGTIDIGQGPSNNYTPTGYCTIRAEQPVMIAKPGFTTEAAATIRTRFDGLRLSGNNITIDGRFISSIYQEDPAGRQHWMDGVTIINSAGRDEMWRSAPRKLSQFVRNAAWFTECTTDGLPNIMNGATLVRNCSLNNGYQDVVSDAACVVHTSTRDWDSSFWAQDVPAMTVTYTGPEATATIELAGNNEAVTRVFTARWGDNSATITVGTSEAMEASGNYRISDVAAWLNGLGVGFAATVQDNSRRAAACALAGTAGRPFTAQNVKNTVLQIVTQFDVHSDWHQQNTGRISENCVLANNIATNLVTQNIFLTASGGARDFLIFNNAFHNKTLGGTYNNFTSISSQLAFAKSHVVIAHNSLASQSFVFRGDQSFTGDQWCLVANNAFRDMSWPGAQANTGLVRDNHVQDGATGTNIGLRTFAGGTREQNFMGSERGDFSVRDTLHAIRRTPVIALDRLGSLRTELDSAGSQTAQPIAMRVASSQPAPASFGGVQFPAFNRQYPGRAGNIAYPSEGIVALPLLSFNTPSAFFIMIQVPHERTNLNREARVIGNGAGGAASTFSLVHYGDDHFDAARHDEFRWRARGSSGDTIDLSVDVQLRGSRWQLIVVSCDGAGGYAINSFARGQAKITGTSQTSANAQLNALIGTHVLLGDSAPNAGALDPLTAPVGAFDGAVAFHGFVHGTAGADAAWQAIAEGADIVSSLPNAASFRLLRDYRRLAVPGSGLAAYGPGDTSLSGTIHGTVTAAGTCNHEPQKFLHIDRLPDGYVACPKDGEALAAIALRGASRGISGALFAQVVSTAGEQLVPPFVCGGTGPVMPISLRLPPFSGWGHLEFWPESDPDVVFRMNSRVGCGHKLSVVGQSQCEIMLYATAMTQSPSGLASFCGYIGLRSDPADNGTIPVRRFSTSSRPQLFVIEPEMTNVFNGVTAIASRIERFGSGQAMCVIDTCIPGSSALDWIRDSTGPRQWALDVEMAGLAGTDRVPVWHWYTSDAASYPALLDGVVHGTGPLAGNYRLFDGTINAPGYRLGICLPSRATLSNPGPNPADDFGIARSGAQAGQLQWATANPTISAIGPAMTDMAIDNLATGTPSGPNVNLGGPHQSQVLPEGVIRLGIRIGETYLRARGLSSSSGNAWLDKANAIVAVDRTSVTIKAIMPNGGALRTQDGRAVAGFEYSLNGGATWFRGGINATITGPDTVSLSLISGAWPAGARISYLRGGPFSYGTAEELIAHYKGSLYDGCEADGGLGFPVLELSATDALVV